MRFTKFIFLLCLLYIGSISHAQNIDSLKTILKKQKGIDYLKTLRRLTVAYTDFGKYDTALIMVHQGQEYATKNLFPDQLAKFFSSEGIIYWNKGEFHRAIQILKKGLRLAEKNKDKQTTADLNNNLGLVYWDNTQYPQALFHLEKSLAQYKELKDMDGLSSSYINLGLIYDDLNDSKNAMFYYNNALSIAKKINDLETVGQCLSNIGTLLDNSNKQNEAMVYHKKALAIFTDLGNKRQMALCNNNIGSLLFDQKKYGEALSSYETSLKLYREIGDIAGLLLILNNMGDIYGILKDYDAALQYFKEAEVMSDTTEMLDHLATSYYGLSETYAAKGEFMKAYTYRVQFEMVTDTLDARKNNLTLNNMRTAFEVKQKETELNARRAEERKIATETKKRQTIIIISVAVGLLLTIVFSGFLYKRIKLSLRQNKIIAEQKHLVEEKNKEITDSINYAKRIQHSVITSENYLKQHLEEFFVLFIPKDIVAGDFYWALDTTKGFLMATADCTGHGVPGAFMSVMGINFLNEITIERKILEPDLILNELRRGIIKTMNPEGRLEEGKDGMDISLYLLNKDTLELTYSAANNPIWIANAKGITELDPDKMPVGKYHSKENDPFTLHSVKLEKGDMIYSFTDGYPDQFGGPKGKKFKYSSLKTACAENYSYHANEQEKKFRHIFESWKANYEQTDDVCLIGVRV